MRLPSRLNFRIKRDSARLTDMSRETMPPRTSRKTVRRKTSLNRKGALAASVKLTAPAINQISRSASSFAMEPMPNRMSEIAATTAQPS